MTQERPSTFPPARRILTGHATLPAELRNVQGAEPAVTIQDSGLPKVQERGINATHSMVWVHDVIPDNTQGPKDRAREIPTIMLQQGVVVRYNELGPGEWVPFHRSTSTDYNIFLNGDAVLVTPSSAFDPKETKFQAPSTQETVCHPGDTVVMRGTLHAWYNPSKENWARWIVVGVGAEEHTPEGAQLPLPPCFWPESIPKS